MSAAETIAKAIEKLTELRTASGTQSWSVQDNEESGRGYYVWENGLGDVVSAACREDAELIVTLHRTIDAQLGMLRGVLRVHQEVVGLDFDNEEVWPIPAWALKLAEAIIGGDR